MHEGMIDSVFSCFNCHKSCLSQEKHPGNHGKVSLSILRFLIMEKIGNIDDSQINSLLGCLKDLLKVIQNSIAQVQNWRLQVGLGLHQSYLKAAHSILEDKGGLQDVACSQVYAIETAVSQDQSKQSNAIYKEKYEQLVKKLTTQFNKILKQPKSNSNTAQSHQTTQGKQSPQKSQSQTQTQAQSPSAVKTLSNLEKQSQKAQQSILFDEEEEPRPSREPAQRRPGESKRSGKNNDPCLKVNELEKVVPGGEYFVTIVKVLRLIKTFRINNRDKQQFLGGDETGKAIYVFDTNPLIQVDNTLRATDCYVYARRGSKQVQNGKKSIVSIYPSIKNIGDQFCLSEEAEDRRRGDRGYCRITDRRNDYRNDGQRRRRRQENLQQENTINRQSRRQNQRLNPKKQVIETKSQQRRESESEQTRPQRSQSNSMEYKKIKDIEPGDDNINLISKINEILEIQETRIICYLGDETGIVKAELPSSLKFVRQSASVKLINVEAAVVNCHIIVKIQQNSRIQPMNLMFPIVKITNDISLFEWQSQEEDT